MPATEISGYLCLRKPKNIWALRKSCQKDHQNTNTCPQEENFKNENYGTLANLTNRIPNALSYDNDSYEVLLDRSCGAALAG
jgi:hypothetical protein